MAACAVFFDGGSTSEPPVFRLNLEGRDAAKVGPEQRKAIAEPLGQLFGTPDKPTAPDGTPLDPARLKTAAGPNRSDVDGNPQGLYRRHCATCHGISGDGAGPAAAALGPYPRDFRSGTYKYTSTYTSHVSGGAPARADVERILVSGMPASAMPSFERLPEGQLDALVDYVTYLSIRGQTELLFVEYVVSEDEYPLDADVILDEQEYVAGQWAAAERMVVEQSEAEAQMPPIDTPELLEASIARGRELYLSENGRCFCCHGREGDGVPDEGDDDEPSELYDDWNKGKQGASPTETEKLAMQYRLPLVAVRPRDFTAGVFRGGSRPIDVYWRIHVGIKGTPMPGAGPSPGGEKPGVLSPAEIWDVVHFVRDLAGL